jgi:hypothetical protein
MARQGRYTGLQRVADGGVLAGDPCARGTPIRRGGLTLVATAELVPRPLRRTRGGG